MEIKEFINKIGKMDTEDLSLVIECGFILSQLKQEEQDKLIKLMDLIIKYQKIHKEETNNGKN